MTNDVHISEVAEEEAHGLSRRQFFAVSGATGAAVVAAAYLTRTPGGASTRSVVGVKVAKPSLNKDLDTAAFTHANAATRARETAIVILAPRASHGRPI